MRRCLFERAGVLLLERGVILWDFKSKIPDWTRFSVCCLLGFLLPNVRRKEDGKESSRFPAHQQLRWDSIATATRLAKEYCPALWSPGGSRMARCSGIQRASAEQLEDSSKGRKWNEMTGWWAQNWVYPGIPEIHWWIIMCSITIAMFGVSPRLRQFRLAGGFKFCYSTSQIRRGIPTRLTHRWDDIMVGSLLPRWQEKNQ